MDNTVEAIVERVRGRVTAKTRIQDVSEPLTGDIDRRKIAAKFVNMEHAVGDLADAVDSLNDRVERGLT